VVGSKTGLYILRAPEQMDDEMERAVVVLVGLVSEVVSDD
jgi:hypothetical protein